MSDRRRILVTDGTYKHTLGIVRQLGPTHDVYVASPRQLSAAGVSRYAYRALRCPLPTDSPSFVAWLDSVIAEHSIDQIIPVGALACELLSTYRKRWLPGTSVVIAAPEQMAIALDKLAVARVAQRIGVLTPRTRQPRAIQELDDAGSEVGYPLVIKAALEGPTGVAYVSAPEQLRPTYEAYLQRYRWKSEALPFLQQRIIGPGFGVFATYQNGRCRRVLAHRRIREFPISGGASTCAELYDDPALLELGRRLLDALAWHGVAMVEFKLDAAQQAYYLLEVNPKFWGSLDLALAAGADFPGDLVTIGDGRILQDAPPATSRLRYCWPLSADLRYLVERPQAWRSVLADWVSPRVRTNVSWSDPLPNLVELAQTVRSLMRR
jgi:predicted ATP-grasp superfamily ATP-dependent carboligase